MEYIKRMRVLLTENCNSSCPHCFNKDMRSGEDMDTERAKILLDYLSNHNVTSIKIMGGEPTTHPDFFKLYEYIQKRFENATLFTNALNEKILEIKPRQKDIIVYNLSLMGKNFNFLKLLPNYNFQRYFETMIGTKTNMEELFSKIKLIVNESRGSGIKENILFNITLDCTENIFENKKILNKKWKGLVKFICEINPNFLDFDHSIPPCFWTQDSIKFIKEQKRLTEYFYTTCRPDRSGLINSSFELLHCNQHPVKIADIFESSERNSRMISFNKLNTLLYKSNMEKLLINLNNDECSSCKYAITKCTGGCFKHKFT